MANACCPGRVVSALEGGYRIHGGIVSPFARSVAAHVRAMSGDALPLLLGHVLFGNATCQQTKAYTGPAALLMTDP